MPLEIQGRVFSKPMSFSSTTDRAQYTGNGSTKDFAVPFPFQADGDIAVVVTTSGVDSTKTLNVDYAVTGEGTEGGGNVRFTTAPASGVTVTIYRDIDLNQTRDFNYNGSFPTSTVTGAADKAMQAIQQLNAKLKRTFRISEASAEIAPLTVADRAGKVTGFDSAGNPVLLEQPLTVLPNGAAYDVASIAALKAISVGSIPSSKQIVVAGYYTPGDGGGGVFYYDSTSTDADNGGTVIAPNSGAGRWRRVYKGALNVRWFGAKGDSSTNDYAAIIAARAAGSPIYFPAGNYKTDTAIPGDLNLISDGAVFSGANPIDPHPGFGPGSSKTISKGNVNSFIGMAVNNLPASTLSFPTGVTAYGKNENNGNQVFGLYCEAKQYASSGVASNEIDAFNYGGAPSSNLPPNRAIGTTENHAVGITLGAGGDYDCSIGIHVCQEGSAPRRWLTGIYFAPDSITNSGVSSAIYIDSDGTNGPNYPALVKHRANSAVGIMIQAVGTAAPLNTQLACVDTAGTTTWSVRQNGKHAHTAANTQTTVGAAGAASVLPANPTGYIQLYIGGNEKVIPYYEKS